MHLTPSMLKRPVVSSVFFALARGIPQQRLVETLGMPIEDLVSSAAQVPDRLMARVWRLMVDTFPGEPLGLEMAAAAPLEVLGIVGHAAQFAPDVRAAIQLFMRYQKVFSARLQMVLVEGPDEVRLEYFHPLDAVDYGMASEVGLGLTVRYARETIGMPDLVTRVEFAHPPLSPKADYAQHLGVPVVFDAPKNAIVYRAALLDQPLPRRSELRLRFVEAHLEAARRAVTGEETSAALARVVEAAIHNGERAEYGAEALARRIGMSLRTLQRHVRAEGSSVRDVLDKVRERNAHELLDDASLGLLDVAFLLGYSTESAFRRAFKRWTGRSPAEHRRVG